MFQPTNAHQPSTRARQQRAEERVICALLHASSPYGFLALLSAGVVWASYKAHSRFVAFQALQAMLFQGLTSLAYGVLLAVFMGGYLYAAFSGLIARTGVTDPTLTTALITAALLGGSCLLFFHLCVPLLGVVAGFLTLRETHFSYPLLGKLARQLTRPSLPGTPLPAASFPQEPLVEGDPFLAGLGHLSAWAGMAPILTPILWATAKQRSRFLVRHLLQAGLFQLAASGFYLGVFGVTWSAGLAFSLLGYLLPVALRDGISAIINTPGFFFCWIGLLGLTFVTTGLLSLLAAIQAFRGRAFGYPLLGRWLETYLSG